MRELRERDGLVECILEAIDQEMGLPYGDYEAAGYLMGPQIRAVIAQDRAARLEARMPEIEAALNEYSTVVRQELLAEQSMATDPKMVTSWMDWNEAQTASRKRVLALIRELTLGGKPQESPEKMV